MSFSNLSLKKKLIAGFLFSALITLIVGLIGLEAINSSSTQIENLISTEQVFLIDAERLQIMALQHRRYEKDFFLNIGNLEKQNKYLGNFEKVSGKTRQILKKIEANLQVMDSVPTEVTTSVTKTQIAYNNYVDNFKKLASTVQQDQSITPQQANKMMKPFKGFIYDFEKGAFLLEETAIKWSNEASVAVTNTGKRSYSLIFGILPIALIINIAGGIMISRILSKPIVEASGFAEKMAKGDFTHSIHTKLKDETGVLVNALNAMGTNLRTIFQDISSGVETLSSASTGLSAISNQMSANAEQTTSKANTVAAAAEEMSVNMDSVAAASEETSVNVNMVAAAAEEMSTTIAKIASNTEETKTITGAAVTQSQNASSQIDELGIAAQEIGKVTETITEISEQTNLLALNATIEAARAGEAGKGFAVVANEIKDLAKQTSDATSEIKNKISKIQSATRNSVTEITQITGVISEVNEMVSTIAVTVDEQSVATQEIAENVSQASQGIQEVNENVAQTSSVTREVATNIAEVSQASSEINGSSSQVHVNAEELSDLAVRLTGLVSQFKV
jgi:methyl-accepting chemotaxis protein